MEIEIVTIVVKGSVEFTVPTDVYITHTYDEDTPESSLQYQTPTKYYSACRAVWCIWLLL